MELFTPSIGLIFWMFIPFLIVFWILSKYAWPVIIKGVNDRAQLIDKSLQAAHEANATLAGIKHEGEQLIAEAESEQLRILKEASEMRNQLIKEAKHQAEIEASKVMQEARIAIQKEKEEAIRDIRKQVALLSIDIAEKVLRKNLEDKPAQLELIDKLLDEVHQAN